MYGLIGIDGLDWMDLVSRASIYWYLVDVITPTARTAPTIRVTTILKHREVGAQDDCPCFWAKSDIYAGLPDIAQVCGLSDEREEETLEAASDEGSGNSLVFCLLWLRVLAARRIWLAWSSCPALSYLFDPSEL